MSAIHPSEVRTPTAGPAPDGTPTAGPAPDGRVDADLDAVAASPAARRWLERDGDGRVGAAHDGELRLLARFCASLGTTPDELVAQCTRATKSGDTAISAAGRRRTDQAISAFVVAEGAVGRDAIVLGNTLRSFLIHNGIFLQGPAAIE